MLCHFSLGGDVCLCMLIVLLTSCIAMKEKGQLKSQNKVIFRFQNKAHKPYHRFLHFSVGGFIWCYKCISFFLQVENFGNLSFKIEQVHFYFKLRSVHIFSCFVIVPYVQVHVIAALL